MKKEDIIASCIDEIRDGKCTIEDCLNRYPYLGDELRPLLEIAIGIKPEAAYPSLEFKQRARSRLLEAMQQPSPRAEQSGRDIFGWPKHPAPARRLSFASIAVTAALVLLIAGGSTVYASQQSLPEDALYAVKRGVENLQLALTSSDEAKASLYLKLAQRRLDEVVAQSNKGVQVSAATLEEVASQTDAAIREMVKLPPEHAEKLVSKLSESTLNQQVILGQVSETAPEAAQPALEQAIDVTRRGTLIAQVAHGNPDYLSSSPSVSDEKLEATYFELEGTLVSAENGAWNVGGVQLTNVNSPQPPPPQGSKVYLKGLVRNGEIIISKIKHKDITDNQVKIKGIFGGASPDGETWYVGGIPVARPQDMALPPEGKKVKVTGLMQEHLLGITETESEEAVDEIEINGTLVSFQPGKKTIVIDVAGAQITINISEALINSESRQPLTLPGLNSLVGSEIKVASPYMKKGILYAKEIYIDVGQTAGPADKEKDEDEDRDKDRGKDKEKDEDEDRDKDRGKDKEKDEDEDRDKDRGRSKDKGNGGDRDN